MPLTRTRRWATGEFHSFLQVHGETPFAWGTNDCALFAANAIEAFTGVDIASDFRGKYHDESSAFAMIHSVTGGTTVADAAAWCASKHGLVEWTHPLCAQRGDLVVMLNPAPNAQDQLIAGVVHLGGNLVTIGEKGIVRRRISAVVRAWKV